ncbi:hypothetical protein N2152v2_011241 [Parachlorella kessleri]
MVFGFGRTPKPAINPSQPLPPVLPPEAPGNGRLFLHKILEESRGALDAPGFELLTTNLDQKWTVHSKAVQGSKLTLVRLEAEVPMPADSLFRLLTSMDGKRIIDPFPREHHAEPIKALRRPPGGGKAGIVYSEAPRFAGMLRPREYVTCDAEAPTEHFFVCKSCLVPEGSYAQAQKGHVRANLLFAMRVKERKGARDSSQLQMVNWLDLGGNTVPEWIANLVTERWYFQGAMRRLHTYIAQHKAST